MPPRFPGPISTAPLAAAMVAALMGCAYSRPEAATVTKDAPPAVDFVLPAGRGDPVSLAGLRERGPVVVVFFRGHWCLYCRAQLDRIQARLGEIKAAGGQLVAVSSDPPAVARKLAEERSYTMPILSDADGKVGTGYGTWDADAGYHVPATIVIDRSGRIRMRYVGEGKRDRVTVDQILAVLREIGP